MKNVTMTITFDLETESDVSDEEIRECVALGLEGMRDNNFVIAHVENFRTGELAEIRISDFTTYETQLKMRGE